MLGGSDAAKTIHMPLPARLSLETLLGNQIPDPKNHAAYALVIGRKTAEARRIQLTVE